MADMKVELVDHMGTDLSVVNAARVSFDKESTWESSCKDCDCAFSCEDEYRILSDRDQRLIKYLARHNHWTPFAHTAISLRVNAPIFVARQLFKHKAGFVENEVSRRYVDSEPEFYVPKAWRKRAENVKQGSSDEVVFKTSIGYETLVSYALNQYKALLEVGVCPEQARMVLPQSMMTEWIWTGNLASYARVYNQRTDPHAQKETREIVQMMGEVIAPLFPVSWAALTVPQV